MKLLLVTLAIIFALSMYVIPSYYIISQCDHHCLNENCGTCLKLMFIVKIINKISKILGIFFFIIIYLSLTQIVFIKQSNILYKTCITPIRLKVKLSN